MFRALIYMTDSQFYCRLSRRFQYFCLAFALRVCEKTSGLHHCDSSDAALTESAHGGANWLLTILEENSGRITAFPASITTSPRSHGTSTPWNRRGSCPPSRCACFRDSSENCKHKSVMTFATTCTPSKIRTCSASGARALIGNIISTLKGQLSGSRQ